MIPLKNLDKIPAEKNQKKVSPKATTDPFSTPTQQRPVLKRRSSIGSDMERRSEFPLTPPRRVSAPLEILLAQCSLKAGRRRDTPKPSKKIIVKVDEDVEEAHRSEVITSKSSTSPEAKKLDLNDRDDSSVASHMSSVNRHETVMPEEWTKIRLPNRSSTRSISSTTSSDHSRRAA